MVTIELPGTLTSIGNNAFQGCTYLGIGTDNKPIQIVIPEKATQLGEGIFKNCENLSTVKLPSGLETLPVEMFYGCSKLVDDKDNPIIPDGVKTIGSQAFYDCYALKTLTIPGSVTVI